MLALEIVCYDDESMILKYAVSPLQVRESVLEGYSGGTDCIEEALKEMEQILNETRSISVNLIYAPLGTLTINSPNVSINGVIIADKVIINGNSVT